MENESGNTKLGHDQTAEEFGNSSSTFQRYRRDIKMKKAYESNSRDANCTRCLHAPKKTQKISNDLKRPQTR